MFGQSSRNDANELAMLVVDAALGGVAGAGGVEGEPAARSAGILRLQQHVAVVAALAADLDRVRAASAWSASPSTFQVFSERSHGWLAENPSTGSE